MEILCGMKNFTPDQVRRMSLAEIGAAIDGFVEFNSGDGANDAPTQEEARAFFDEIAAREMVRA